jgi:putative DNA primase/helicase
VVADDRVDHALALWRESVDPRGTLAERYLASRGLQLGDEVAGNVLRWHARIGAAVALFRNIETNRPQAVTRIYLDSNGNKVRRAFLGPVGGAAIKLDHDDAVTNGLHIGEGVETCMAARQLGLRPCWALGSAGAIAAFPVLSGVEALTILAENDDASAKAVDACAARWHAARREVLINEPIGGKDLNDAIKGGAV